MRCAVRGVRGNSVEFSCPVVVASLFWTFLPCIPGGLGRIPGREQRNPRRMEITNGDGHRQVWVRMRGAHGGAPRGRRAHMAFVTCQCVTHPHSKCTCACLGWSGGEGRDFPACEGSEKQNLLWRGHVKQK